MIVPTEKILGKAHREGYAVGAFNINNMEILQAVIRAAQVKGSPVLVQTSEGAIDYAGAGYLRAMVDVAADAPVPVALHLDHGRDMDVIKDCIRRGWTSVMYDGSHLPFEENVRNTRKVVQMAHRAGVSVEAELGTIGGAEDKVSAREIVLTEPADAVRFADRTGCDFLAIAIGTSHGAYKFEGSARLDIGRLKTIKELVDVPLVLHGASQVPEYLVRQANNFGARLGHPQGVPDEQILRAVKNGISKINTDTDLRLAMLASVRETLVTRPSVFDPRKILGPARDRIQKVVEHRMQVFGSAGKA